MAAASEPTKKLIRNSAHNQSLSALKLPELEMQVVSYLKCWKSSHQPNHVLQTAEFRDAHNGPGKRRSTFHDMKSAMAQDKRANSYKVHATDAGPEGGAEEESTAAKMEKMRKMRRSWGDSLGQCCCSCAATPYS